MRGLEFKEVKIIKRACLLTALVLFVGSFAWSNNEEPSHIAKHDEATANATPNELDDETPRIIIGETESSEDEYTNDTTTPPFDYSTHLGKMPDSGAIKLRYKHVPRAGRLFNDSNHIHLASAKALGINPINRTSDAWKLKRPVVHIKSCKEYYVDDLTHSMPFLVPEAAELLCDIGRTFNDSLAARGGGDYRIKVTSVLRTKPLIDKLQRRNVNAIDSSAHQFATTFDISYINYACDSHNVVRTQNDLRGLLTEIVADLYRQGRCHVKFERKQACLHITVRNKPV